MPAWAWRLAVIASALGGWSVPAAAFSFKKTSTGVAVHWARGPVAFTPALSPSPGAVPSTEARAATERAISTWLEALAGAGPALSVAATTAAAAPHVSDGVNTVRWALDRRDPDVEAGVLALTFIAYRVSDGAIEDADIVLNAADFAWTAADGGCTAAYDLESALAHEVGHAIGLGHSADHADATMFATGDVCETGKRDLTADDEAGIVALYADPPQLDIDACAAGRSPGWGVAVALAAVLARRRRRGRAVAISISISVAACALAGRAEASQLRYLELSELGGAAALVVRGHVTTATTTPDGPIETVHEIRVEACLAGDCPTTVQVVRRGGERGDVGLWVDGEAVLAPGDEVVLYLRRDAVGRLRAVGGVQGAFRVVVTAAGAIAVRDLRAHQVRVGDGWRAGALEAIELAALARQARRLGAGQSGTATGVTAPSSWASPIAR